MASHITLQIMGQISKLSFAQYPSAKLNKRKLQKAKIRVFSSSPLFWSFLQKFQLDLKWRHAQDFRTIFGIQIGSILLREIQQTYFTQCTGYTNGRSLGEKAIAEYYDAYSTVFISYDIHTPRHLPDTLRHHPDTFQTPIYTIQTPPDIGIFNTPEGIGRKGNIWT